MQHLFAYGSLAPGGSNAHIMQDIPGRWQPASVRGRVLRLGWGESRGYLALRPDPGAAPVPGWLFSSDALAAHLARLDAFEGAQYQRVRVTATLPDGRELPAFVYALHPSEQARVRGAP